MDAWELSQDESYLHIHGRDGICHLKKTSVLTVELDLSKEEYVIRVTYGNADSPQCIEMEQYNKECANANYRYVRSQFGEEAL